MSNVIIQIFFASSNTHYTISSRAFLKKIKRVAALILSVCVFVELGGGGEVAGAFCCGAARRAVRPQKRRSRDATRGNLHKNLGPAQ